MKYRKYKFGITLLITLLVAACHNVPKAFTPAGWVLDQAPKEGPITYRQGWIDGCKTGLSSMTNTYYKTFYQFTQDANLRSDPLL